MQQIFFLEPEPGAGHSWTGSTTLVLLASFYFYLNHILNICVWVACCRACHRGGRRRRAPAEHDAWARGSSWRRLSGRCRCSPPPGRPAPPPRQDRAPGHAPARGLIDCNRLNRDWYRYVFLLSKLRYSVSHLLVIFTSVAVPDNRRGSARPQHWYFPVDIPLLL